MCACVLGVGGGGLVPCAGKSWSPVVSLVAGEGRSPVMYFVAASFLAGRGYTGGCRLCLHLTPQDRGPSVARLLCVRFIGEYDKEQDIRAQSHWPALLVHPSPLVSYRTQLSRDGSGACPLVGNRFSWPLQIKGHTSLLFLSLLRALAYTHGSESGTEHHRRNDAQKESCLSAEWRRSTTKVDR